MKKPLLPLALTLLAGALTGCTVETLDPKSRPAVPNSCKDDKDCGSNAFCNPTGACNSRSSTIDEVLLEIVPEASSPFGGTSFLSMQDGVRHGGTLAIALAGPVTFPVQVQVNGEVLADGCPYLHTGKQTVAARVQFTRTGSIGGVSVAGLSNKFTVTVDTEQNSATPTSGFSKSVSLVPGVYDIYAQPVSSANCPIAAKVWRGVEVARDGMVVAWAPPATLELPLPLTLGGRVQRKAWTLADWQLEIIDPLDEKVISTSARLGATTDASPFTNFEITYQPSDPTMMITAPGLTSGAKTAPVGPLIRLKPPKGAEDKAPTVYFDLWNTDWSGSGQVNLDVSNLPTPSQLVTVSGQVRGATNDGVRATVKFLNTTFLQGVPAAFGPAVTTDAVGRYTTSLFPGNYHVVIIPDGATDDGSAVPGGNPTRLWALTERDQAIGVDANQMVDFTAAPMRSIDGIATARADRVPAQGATLEAAPLVDASSGVLHTLLAHPISPARASVPVDDTNGQFKLALDPGTYDLSLKPAATSNFAWWVCPAMDVPVPSGTAEPELLYPVPVDGTITVVSQDRTSSQTLRNATVRVYAITPLRGVTQVGTARTDDMGRYYIALPPGFASAP